VVFIVLELSKSAQLVDAQGLPSDKTSLHGLDCGEVAGPLALP